MWRRFIGGSLVAGIVALPESDIVPLLESVLVPFQKVKFPGWRNFLTKKWKKKVKTNEYRL